MIGSLLGSEVSAISPCWNGSLPRSDRQSWPISAPILPVRCSLGWSPWLSLACEAARIT